MSEAKYTKGPWYIEEDMIATDDLEIAFLGALGGYMTMEIREANGRLIAAAPELLEALIDVMSAIERHFGKLDPVEGTPMSKAYEAIAKATGA